MGEQVLPADIINTRPVLPVNAPYQLSLQRLSTVEGLALNQLPELSLVRLTLNTGEQKIISLIRNMAHTNVYSLFGEESRFVPEEQTLTVVESVVGSYPNVLYAVNENDLSDFVQGIETLSTELDYQQLLKQYAIKRNDPNFWEYSDSVHDLYFIKKPIEAGFFRL